MLLLLLSVLGTRLRGLLHVFVFVTAIQCIAQVCNSLCEFLCVCEVFFVLHLKNKNTTIMFTHFTYENMLVKVVRGLMCLSNMHLGSLQVMVWWNIHLAKLE